MTFQEALVVFTIGSLLVATGLTLLVVSLRDWSHYRAAPIFGVFVLLYGVRLMVKSPLLWEATGLSASWFRFTGHWITYVIPAPAGMFMEALAAPKFRPILRRVWQLDFIYAALAIAADVALRRPGSVLWLNASVVMINFTIGTACLIASVRTRHGEQLPRQTHALRGGLISAITGALIFAVLAFYETFLQRSPIAGVTSLEPVGMLAFIIGLGYFVADRAIESERRLVSISKELETARSIQQSILPVAPHSTPSLEIVARYLPMTEVAGDFYDFLDQADGRLGVLVADVSGHGVPAALIASMVKIALAAQAGHANDPSLVMAGMNRALCGSTSELTFITATYAFLDPTGGTLSYASAGHPPILLQRSNGEIERMEEGDLVLGFDANASYSTASSGLKPGDRLLMYTDGLVEAADARGAFFGEAKLFESLSSSAGLDLSSTVTRLINDMNAWRGRNSRLEDDVTVVAVALRPGTHLQGKG
jgi:sigma-B regulation protein RsbU (phosphoserine phosphatase)